MNIKSAFPSELLKAADLNKAVMVTIADVTVEKIGDDEKPVLHFKGTNKRLALNKTNAAIIAEVLQSDETDDWIGRKIQLYPTKTEYQGKRVPCIRVSDQLPAQQQARPQAPPPQPDPEPEQDSAPFHATDDDVPF